jgi:hypothetical protein
MMVVPAWLTVKMASRRLYLSAGLLDYTTAPARSGVALSSRLKGT